MVEYSHPRNTRERWETSKVESLQSYSSEAVAGEVELNKSVTLKEQEIAPIFVVQIHLSNFRQQTR